ncbi:GNAT family N-acetyltransferase [Clostridium transplantifaecale]|uniref:GNAT family N-acetyltransferase n=1 Tax=Clostridium transplantifaecale TaxID=2479838 RepID=UPI000F63CD87|nr:GNAT family N-acetyltransferase [Clostridium transplantifaecale]
MTDYTIRRMGENEYPLLNDFLYEAIFVPDGATPPPKSVTAYPELKLYVEHFGDYEDDLGFVAEISGKAAGAVWVRIMDDYGHLDGRTPSLAISLYREYRGLGIGTALMKSMLGCLKEHGYERVSLSVQKANYAVRMYQNLGFEAVRENDEEYIMVHNLSGLS